MGKLQATDDFWLLMNVCGWLVILMFNVQLYFQSER